MHVPVETELRLDQLDRRWKLPAAEIGFLDAIICLHPG